MEYVTEISKDGALIVIIVSFILEVNVVQNHGQHIRIWVLVRERKKLRRRECYNETSPLQMKTWVSGKDSVYHKTLFSKNIVCTNFSNSADLDQVTYWFGFETKARSDSMF